MYCKRTLTTVRLIYLKDFTMDAMSGFWVRTRGLEFLKVLGRICKRVVARYTVMTIKLLSDRAY